MPSATQHSSFVSTARKLIDRHGRNMILVSSYSTGPSFDPTITENLLPIVGVEADFKSGEIDGDLIRLDDKQILVDADVDIDTTMQIRDDDKTYAIISRQLIRPGTLKIMYILQVRL